MSDPEAALRTLVQPIVEAAYHDTDGPHECGLECRRAVIDSAILACARAQAEALREVPHESSLSAAEHRETNVKPANMDEWMPCPYSPCRQLAAAEALVARLSESASDAVSATSLG